MSKPWKLRLALLVVLAVVGALIAPWSIIVNLTKQKMPDLSLLEPRSLRPVPCPTGMVIGRQGFNEPGSDVSLNEAVVWYATPTDARALRPFIVVLFRTDTPNGVIRIYADLDRDGRVDFSGMPGDPELGEGACDVVGRVSGPVKAPIIIPAKNRKVIL